MIEVLAPICYECACIVVDGACTNCGAKWICPHGEIPEGAAGCVDCLVEERDRQRVKIAELERHISDRWRREAMRINVYSQELTEEVIRVEKQSNTGVVYHAAQLILHSSPMLHHPSQDDDRSAVTFWLPRSASRREAMAQAFEEIARIFREAPPGGLD